MKRGKELSLTLQMRGMPQIMSMLSNNLPSLNRMDVFNLPAGKAFPKCLQKCQLVQCKIVPSKELGIITCFIHYHNLSGCLAVQELWTRKKSIFKFHRPFYSSVAGRWLEEEQINEYIRNPRKCSNHKPSHPIRPLIIFAILVMLWTEIWYSVGKASPADVESEITAVCYPQRNTRGEFSTEDWKR